MKPRNRFQGMNSARARIFRPFKKPKNRFPAWRAGTTTLFVVPARQATWAGEIDSSESIPGLHKRLQMRALAYVAWRAGRIILFLLGF
jgi:hypothetical protein